MDFKLKDMRERRGLSIKQMYQALHVNESRYRKWESGVNGIPLDYAMEACVVLRCSLDELAGRVIPALKPDEQLLLDYYRATDDRGRLAIMSVAESQQGVEGSSAGYMTDVLGA